MSRFKDFDAARAEAMGEPLTFKLGGEMFTATGEVPAAVLLDLGAAINSSDTIHAFALMQELLERLVAPEEEAQFARAMRRVGLESVLELVRWIVEETTGRPFVTASSSPAQPSEDGAPSKLASVSWAPEAHSG